jgi:hypothetical protein
VFQDPKRQKNKRKKRKKKTLSLNSRALSRYRLVAHPRDPLVLFLGFSSRPPMGFDLAPDETSGQVLALAATLIA